MNELAIQVYVIIPALDEEAAIGGVVRAALSEGVQGVIVVDNGSSDATAARAEEAGAIVVTEPRRGYGFACNAGSLEAISRGADLLAFMDGDHSSDPHQLDRVLAPLEADEADLVLGSRVLGNIEPGAMLVHQRLGNRLAAAILRRLYGVTVTDLGPFRAIRSAVFDRLAMSEMTFGWPTEMTVKCVRDGWRIVEVPVSWSGRREGKSKVSGTIKGSLLAGYHIFRVTFRHRMRHRKGSSKE